MASGSGRGMSVLALVHGGALKFVLLREFHNDGVVLFDGAEREKASSRGVGPAGCLARAWELGRRGERETGRRGRFPGWRAGRPMNTKKHRFFIDGWCACVWVCECVVWERGRTDTQGSSQPEAYRQ